MHILREWKPFIFEMLSKSLPGNSLRTLICAGVARAAALPRRALLLPEALGLFDCEQELFLQLLVTLIWRQVQAVETAHKQPGVRSVKRTGKALLKHV